MGTYLVTVCVVFISARRLAVAVGESCPYHVHVVLVRRARLGRGVQLQSLPQPVPVVHHLTRQARLKSDTARYTGQRRPRQRYTGPYLSL